MTDCPDDCPVPHRNTVIFDPPSDDEVTFITREWAERIIREEVEKMVRESDR